MNCAVILLTRLGVTSVAAMAPEQLRKALEILPFRPLMIETGSGKKVRIEHPDYAKLSPAGRTLIVFSANDDAAEIIDVFLITSLSVAGGSEALAS